LSTGHATSSARSTTLHHVKQNLGVHRSRYQLRTFYHLTPRHTQPRCPPVTLPAQHVLPPYTTSHRTSVSTGHATSSERSTTLHHVTQNLGVHRSRYQLSTFYHLTSRHTEHRCPPVTLPAQHVLPPYIISHRTSRSPCKLLEANEQRFSAAAQQKSEAYDSGLDSDAATRTTTEHQSLPAAVVDLQKVKDVLEHPPSRGRTHKEDDNNDDERDIKGTCDGNDVSTSNCVEHVDNSNTRQTVDLSRSVYIYLYTSTMRHRVFCTIKNDKQNRRVIERRRPS